MRVFKFGGASVSSAGGVRNITEIIKHQNNDQLVIVISAMGKMTNAFETLIKAYTTGQNIDKPFEFIKDFHKTIITDLFEAPHQVYTDVASYYNSILDFFNQNTNTDYNYIYDQIVGYGELISTTIISHYFKDNGLTHTWLDAHQLIKTNNQYRSAVVDWKASDKQIKNLINQPGMYLTQGFISAYDAKTFTTLGREGSDYSAAILAYVLDAESMSIWKDVLGVLNADPRHFKQTRLLEKISYRETLEMAFYGATVIHPKTIKPLENKSIPLYVKSFVNPDTKGTTISKGVHIYPEMTCYTFKDSQILLSIATRDFSFMIEQNISHVFELFTQYQIKVNLIQNTATSFTVCVEDLYNRFNDLAKALSEHYELDIHQDVQLITLRHATDEALTKYLDHENLLLIQNDDFATQIVLK